jgi:F-type H+-transporting ATPase subunit b
MPQLNFAEWPPQLFWLAVTFIILYFVVLNSVIPGIGGAIKARKTQIESDLEAAQRLKLETEKAIAAYDAAVAAARTKAHAIAQETRDALSAETDKQRQALDAELATRLAAAEKSIAASKATALESVQAVAADIAADIVGQLTGAKIDKAQATAAVAKVR